MSALVRGAALFVALTCVVWVAVLWRWSVTARDMDTQDIVVYLGLLPLAVFALALLLRWASLGAAQAAAAAGAAGSPASAAAGSTGSADTAEAAQRHAMVQLLGSQLVCAAGASPAELMSAAKDSAPRPALDAELRDEHGMPVFTARIADLDVATLQSQIDPHLLATCKRQPEWTGLLPQDHVLRGLAALREPLQRGVDTLQPWHSRFEPPAGHPRGAAPERQIRVLLNWPAEWTAFEQALANAWATELVTTRDETLPPGCFAITPHSGNGEELLLHADRLLQSLARDGHDAPLIVAACHSAIGEAAVAALERSALVFDSRRRPHGRMPGEAAAALVLANAAWPAAPDAALDGDAPPQHLHRPALLRRDKSVEAPGRVGSDIVSQAMAQALLAARTDAVAVAALVCDADQHTARGGEVYGGAQSLMPQLDAAEDVRLIGTVTGAVGAVGALLVVACAAECAKASDKPCVAATLGDPFARLALLALPAAPVPVSSSVSAPTPAPTSPS